MLACEIVADMGNSVLGDDTLLVTSAGLAHPGYFEELPDGVLHAALDAAASGPLLEGNVGGGTGMNCYEFKGGSGTASRVVAYGDQEFTVGALVQANFGGRDELTIAGVPGAGGGAATSSPKSSAPPKNNPAPAPEKPPARSPLLELEPDSPLVPERPSSMPTRPRLRRA